MNGKTLDVACKFLMEVSFDKDDSREDIIKVDLIIFTKPSNERKKLTHTTAETYP